MIKRCEICKTEFETINPNKKYCSDECRKEHIREADKLRKREARKEARNIQSAEMEKEKRIKREKRQQEDTRRRSEREKEERKKAVTGDPLARMRIAEVNSIDYWEAYKQYEIEYANRWNKESTRTVNDISVNEPDFAQKVVQTIKELGTIRARL